jgi:hypothetical protein
MVNLMRWTMMRWTMMRSTTSLPPVISMLGTFGFRSGNLRFAPIFCSSNLRFHWGAISASLRYSLGRNLPSVDVPRRQEEGGVAISTLAYKYSQFDYIVKLTIIYAGANGAISMLLRRYCKAARARSRPLVPRGRLWPGDQDRLRPPRDDTGGNVWLSSQAPSSK